MIVLRGHTSGDLNALGIVEATYRDHVIRRRWSAARVDCWCVTDALDSTIYYNGTLRACVEAIDEVMADMESGS